MSKGCDYGYLCRPSRLPLHYATFHLKLYLTSVRGGEAVALTPSAPCK